MAIENRDFRNARRPVRERRDATTGTPTIVRIHSADNHFQRAEVLRRNRQKRQRYGEFFLEGVQPINTALAHGWEIRAFLYSPEHGLSDWARDILRRSTARTHFELPPSLLAQLSGKTETSELLAIVAMPPDGPARIRIGECPCIVVFDRPSSPGNLGTLIRTCDALRANGVIITGHGADLYDPETISASRGSLFALPVIRLPGPREILPWLVDLRQRMESLEIIAMDEAADTDIWHADLTVPTVLLLGNEKWGLSAAFHEMATTPVRIPMDGAATSLNVAVAGSVALYEMRRQRSLSE